jgi:hypothetical protein
MLAVSRVASCPGSVGASMIRFQEQYFQVGSPGLWSLDFEDLWIKFPAIITSV